MENTITEAPVVQSTEQIVRDFVELVLAFGPPVENATLAQLFKDTNALHYGSRANNCRASIDAISRAQWDKIHFTEMGAVLHNVMDNPMAAVMTFIKREMAKKGFAVDMQGMNPTVHQRICNTLTLVSGFYETYRNKTAAGAKLLSSISLPNMPTRLTTTPSCASASSPRPVRRCSWNTSSRNW
jgi:nitrogen fixation/metabolism regulation signal transduction histidine kinase